jgi:asparaginyl-tRNA synthetase
LQLEALACSLGAVYTTNKSFRAEHSSTHKHLSEFEHLEIENIFTSLDQLMDVAEKYIMFVGSYLLKHSDNDIENLGKFVSKGLRDRIITIIQTPFVRISYTEAIEILQKASSLSKPVVYGEDLCSEFENYLTNHFKTGVFVRDWPSSIKSFYMKQLPIGNTYDNTNVPKCSNFDLIMPYGIGELIGGSEREDKLDVLLDMMKEKGVKEEPLRWYTDLRRFGSVPHAGFGLGLDRMCMMFTGMENIKDCVAFPVHYKHCEY